LVPLLAPDAPEKLWLSLDPSARAVVIKELNRLRQVISSEVNPPPRPAVVAMTAAPRAPFAPTSIVNVSKAEWDDAIAGFNSIVKSAAEQQPLFRLSPETTADVNQIVEFLKKRKLEPRLVP
jgi:hypothetical protein